MTIKDPSNKVIPLAPRISPRGGTTSHGNNKIRRSNTRVIAITSGKGGVGKTNIVANLGYMFSKLGKQVLIFDADLGLANLDVLLGLAPTYNLSHVITGARCIEDIIVEGPGNMKILPASSGIQELTQLSKEQKIEILTDLDKLLGTVDLLIIDTAAGISSNVMDFNLSAHEIIVVVSPDPTAITDAYALMKVLSLKYAEKHCKLLVNLVHSHREGWEVFRQLSLVTERFLDISVEYMGSVLFDDRVTKGVRQQKLVSDIYPEAQASKCFAKLAQRIQQSPHTNIPKGDTNFFWRHLVRDSVA
jgi:flagellar biosynthesis protein FlhG